MASTSSSSSRVIARPRRSSKMEELLIGVVLLVDLGKKNQDRSLAVKSAARAMGAEVLEKFTKEVTHVIYKDGSFVTYQKAKLFNVHLVSLLWLEAVKKNMRRVPERSYPALVAQHYLSIPSPEDPQEQATDTPNDISDEEDPEEPMLSQELITQSNNGEEMETEDEEDQIRAKTPEKIRRSARILEQNSLKQEDPQEQATDTPNDISDEEDPEEPMLSQELITQSNNGEDQIRAETPEKIRRSGRIFAQKATTIPMVEARKGPIKASIVCTRFHRPEVANFEKVVRKLGRFVTELNVTHKTTHLVVGDLKRTVNLLKAIAMGCWIVKHDWLLRSNEAGRWLPESDFEATEFSPAVQECRLERETLGIRHYRMAIFAECGRFFVASLSEDCPKTSDLRRLIEMCGGTVTYNHHRANLVIGQFFKGFVCLTPLWVLDSITLNKIQNKNAYKIKRPSSSHW